MKVKEAYQKLADLERLANNMRLVNQYFLQLSEEELEEIAAKHGISSPIRIVTSEATQKLQEDAEKLKICIEESEICM